MSIFATSKAVAALAFRLGELDAEVRSLKTASRALELEFTELYDKVRHQMSRMAKRAAVEQKENGEELIEETPDDGLDPISRSIMLRRGMPRMKR